VGQKEGRPAKLPWAARRFVKKGEKMTKDFSCAFQGKQRVAGRSLLRGSAGFLTKGVGVTLTGAALLVFCGSMFMGWMIQSGLNDLSCRQESKVELLKIKNRLEAEKNALVAQGAIAVKVQEMGLFPASASKMGPYIRKYAVR